MRKFKILPSILMLVLCAGILAVGIYAVSPAQNNISGTITVIASNVEVEITAYLGTAKTTKVSDTITARTSTPVPIKDGKLEFNGSSASGVDAVEDITLVLEIKNNSASKTLGAFFLKDASLPETLTTSNITKSISFDGKTTDNTKTTTNLVTASLPGYTQISAGATIDLVCTLSLNQLTDYDMNVALNLPLVIHEYDEDLNAVNVSLSFEPSLDGTDVIPTITTSGSGEYKMGDTVTLTATLASEDVYSSHYPVWYAKNSSGEWHQVSTEATYTFTISDTSPTEFKVIYVVKDEYIKVTIVAKSYLYDNELNDALVTVGGDGKYLEGENVTLSAVYAGTEYGSAYFHIYDWYSISLNGEEDYLGRGQTINITVSTDISEYIILHRIYDD